MLKAIRIGNHEILLRSYDNGKSWNSSPANLLAARNRRAKEREEIQQSWNSVDATDSRWRIDFPEESFACGVRV